MKKTIKKCLLIVISLCFVSPISIKANFIEDDEVNADKLSAFARITNVSTGEVKEINTEVEAMSVSKSRTSLDYENYNAEFSVYLNSDGNDINISPRISETNEKDETICRAYIQIDYDLSVGKDKIKINRFSGGWQRRNPVISVGGCLVELRQHFITGNILSKKFNDDEFSYNINWGWYAFAVGDLRPSAYTSARVVTSSYEGYDIELFFRFPN